MLHSTYNAQTDSWTGMVGMANVIGTAPAVPAISGVDYTEYRVNNGAWTEGNTVTVSAVGAYAIEYRSADKAGNVRRPSRSPSPSRRRSPRPTDPRRRPDGRRRRDATATATATATPNTPAATPTPPSSRCRRRLPPPSPSPRSRWPSRPRRWWRSSSRAARVRATCTEAMNGQATVTVTSKVRKALKLKSATLAKGHGQVQAGTTTITLEPFRSS